MGLTELIAKFSGGGKSVLEKNLASRFQNIRDYLAGLPEIRVFTANSQNFGHQASTVNILRNLIRMGIKGPYTLVLYGRDLEDVLDLASKISTLIPQYAGLDKKFTLNGSTVNVAALYPGKPALSLADFAINGGFDDVEDKQVPYDQLNVLNYVQLQPYAWERGSNKVRINDGGFIDIINLDDLSPHTNLRRRGFYLQPEVTADDWEKMLAGSMKRQVEVCKYLLEELAASRIFLTAGYGFATKGGGFTNLSNFVAGIRASQDALPAARKPTVLLALGYGATPSNDFDDALFGILDTDTASQDFNTYWKDQISPFVSCVGQGEGGINLERARAAVAKLLDDKDKNKRVLVIFVDRVPGPLFNELYRKASLPPFFEGQNTAELMLNLGKPYLKVSSNLEDAQFGYPTLPLNSLGSGASALSVQGRAFNGVVASTMTVWFSTRDTYPPTQLPPVTDAYLTPGGNDLATYFTSLRTFFHDELNDKLLRGLDLFVNMLQPATLAADKAALAVQPRPGALEEENVVEDLYKRLVAFTDKGVLNLLQAVTSGDIKDFFADTVVDRLFTITDAKPEINADKSLCTLTGETTAFGTDIGPAKLHFEFTDDNDTGKLRTVFRAEFTVRWALPGADWLALENPAFSLTMGPAGKVPFSATFSARVTAGLAADMSITVPIEPGVLQFQVDFVDPKPGIANIFQLVGGINLTQYLPSQLQLLADINVVSFTLRYNYSQNSVDVMSARLATPKDKEWALIPAVKVTSINMEVSVISPGNRAARKTQFAITGDFAIAEATAYITANAPQLRVQGGLRDNSKPLSVRAIVEAYLGKSFADILPDPIAKAQISRLAFLVDQGAGRYSFGMTVETQWKIPFDSPIFTVTELGFDIDATSREIDTPPKKGSVIAVNGAADPKKATTTEITGSFTGNVIVDTAEADDAKARITLSAKYLGAKKGWTFSGQQTGGEINLGYLINKYLGLPKPPDEYNYALEGLSLTASTGDGSWSFGAKTKGEWSVPFIPDLKLKASFKAGKNAEKKPKPMLTGAVADNLALATFADLRVAADDGKFARLDVQFIWNSIDLNVWYDYSKGGQAFGVTWGLLEAEVSNKNEKKEWIGKLRFTEGTTLGAIVSRMVSWLTGSEFALESPWSVLNSIPLTALSLEFNFTTKAVSFNVDIGPIDLGIARIDSISVKYNNDTSKNAPAEAKKGVFVVIKGSFPWNVGENANGNTSELGPWDTSKPGTAPAPPGNGNKYFDLRLLALGQHVTATCFPSAKTIQAAIECMATLPDTNAGEVPNIAFAPESSWLIGAEFGVLRFGDEKKDGDKLAGTELVRTGPSALAKPPDPKSGYMLTLQIVFNDPTIYGLRIALAGPSAKIFKGLDFQVMYRQISDSVGVYQAEITLPDIMRYLTVGAYSITLPVFGIAVYTNGDFQIDVGFPWNQDFSRSFSIEAIVPPGLPLLGSAGFYFGKLSSATSNQVPTVTNGTFNPVIVFGFGLQVGVGKSIRYGILSAGFSITVFGIIEGVLGKWNPYQLTDGGSSSNSQLQGAYYFWLRGTVGLIGKLFGSVDFAIIKAEVNIEIRLMLQLTYETYVSMAITVMASVSVSVSISIDLGLFSISISFSFSMRIKETFTIENHGTPPWKIAAPAQHSLMRAGADARLRSRKPARLLGAATASLNWSNLTESTTKTPLVGYLVPGLTIAHDEWDATNSYAAQIPCYVTVVTIGSVPGPTQENVMLRAAAAAEESSFEKLAKMALRWAIAAQSGRTMSPQQVDDSIITATALQSLIDEHLHSTDDNPTPIPASDAAEFMRRQFLFTLSVPPSTGSSDSTFFPMPAELSLKVDAWKSDREVSYRFKEYNQLSKEMLTYLRGYFDELAVKVQQEQGTPRPRAAAPEETPLSMAEWIFSDYFLLIVRQMVQAARDSLRQFKVQLTPGITANTIVSWLNQTGNLGGSYTLYELFAANQTHPLNAGKPIVIGVRATARQTEATLSFDGIAEYAIENAAAFTAADIAIANATATSILKPGVVVTYASGTYIVSDGNSLLDIAGVFKVTLAELLINSDILSIDALREGAGVLLPYATYRALTSDSFSSIAALPLFQSGFDAKTLATQNATRSILRAAVKITAAGKDYVTIPDDTLADVAVALEITLSQLLDTAGLLANPQLLAPVAVLALPPLRISTAEGDTLSSIVERFAVSMEVLAFPGANGDQADLFNRDGKNGSLDAPHLPQFRVKELLDELQRGAALPQLSGMASRYYLHGLRLPTSKDKDLGIQPVAAKGLWVRDVGGKLTLPSRAGLYALTGQQFKVPVLPNVKDTPPFIFRLMRSGAPAWMIFDGGKAELAVSIAWDSVDAERIRVVTSAATSGSTAIPLSELGRGEMYRSEPVRFSFTSSLVWQSASAISLPYGDRTAGGVPSLRLWRTPDAMINLPRTAKVGTSAASRLPRFKIQIARYDEATGGTVPSNVSSYGWAATIDFTVKRVPEIETSVSSKTTYEVVGASGNSILLLERIVDQLQSDNAAFDSIYVGFAPEQTGPASQGIQTDDPSKITYGIAQVNLSTITNPPRSGDGLRALEAAGLGPLNSPVEFLQLLWTASISRSGGFYLYYFDAGEKRGLPSRLFNDRNEAALTLAVIFAAPANEIERNRLGDYMNAVAIAETVESVNSVVFAESDPSNFVVASAVLGSLDSIAFDYYTDAVIIATDNKARTLNRGAKIVVREGIYQPPPGPGIPLSTVLSTFSITLDQLRAANPRYNGALPDPVTLPVALNLPRRELVSGTSSNSGSFDSIASFYGQSVSSLAADPTNRAVSPIFSPGQSIAIASGPTTRTATVPPGVQALLARRDAADKVPLRPETKNYAAIFLANNFSLLSYTVAANPYFRYSNLGLPAGPESKPAEETFDKLMIPAPLAEVKEWKYKQSVPYPQFTVTKPLAAADFLPPAGDNPYRGIGSILQVQFDWQDLYGNTLITGLTSPTSAVRPYNQPPMLLGYTDPLIGLAQWPSIASSYRVDVVGGAPEVQIFLSFDASRYEGLLSAAITGPDNVTVVFTSDVDKTSATTIGNYTIEGYPNAVISATLADARTVWLSASLPIDRELSLVVNNVESADQKRQFSGQASFVGSKSISSSLTQAAKNARRTYAQMFYQFNDSNGVALSAESTLLKQAVSLDGELPGLKQWFFEGESGKPSIYSFINDRAEGNTKVDPPPPSRTLHIPIASGALKDDQIFLIEVSFTMRRTSGAVLDDLATTPGIVQSTSVVSPRLAQVSGDGDSSTVGLIQFATLFQNALSVAGQTRWKIATGVDRRSVTSARNGSSLWVVKLGLQTDPQLPISYTIANGTTPAVFAPRPISNELQSRSGVNIVGYVTGKGLTGPTTTTNFANVDMDTWGRQFFSSVDGVLTPEFTSAIEIVGNLRKTAYLKLLLEQKEKLASVAKVWMIPAYESQSGADASRVQEAYYQQMLSTLASAYTTRAALEYNARVRASVPDPEFPDFTPRLFGSITISSPRILSVISTEDALSVVVVAFSTAMSAAAGDAANYTVSQGLTVLSTAISADEKTVTLILNGEVQLGITTLTVSNAVKDKARRSLHPPLSWTIRRVGDVRDLAREIGFTSPKLDLKDQDKAPIPFLIMGPETVRGETGEIVAELELDLSYAGTDIEHQISRPEDVKGYVASSWLSFVVRDEDWPLERDLGTARIPLPLRSFPTSPSMTAQTPGIDPEAPSLTDLARWSYNFTYQLPLHYPQDRVMCTVEFNIRPQDLLSEADLVSAFNELAQFITIFPSVSTDLIKFLGAVDATTEATNENVVDAGIALASTIQMLKAITDKATKAGALIVPPLRNLEEGDPSLRYDFYIQEGSIRKPDSPENGALLVSLVGTRPEGVGMPWVHIGDSTWTPQRYTGTAPDGHACDNAQCFCFVYIDADGNYLSAENGQAIVARIVELPDLDLFQRQNAKTTASIKRNIGLAEPFVYSTSNVGFANPLQPTVDSSKVYNIAALDAAGAATRSLSDQLKNLFNHLLERDQQPTISLGVEVAYHYALNPNVPAVALPVFLQTPLNVRVKENKQAKGAELPEAPTLDQVIAAWTSALQNWFETTLPPGTDGVLQFSLTLMTNLVEPPMPLLWARNLELQLEDIVPPLPVREPAVVV